MKRLLVSLLFFVFVAAGQAAPLRVFIRGGEKNRGNEIHAHPRFLAEWKTLLAERGMTVEGATAWPTAEQAAKADVIVAYAQDGGDATPAEEKVLEDFAKRGGGLVVIHTAAVSFTNPAWWRDMIGGAWVPKQTKWKEGPMDLYYTENQYIGGGHPITKGASNFHLDDEIYYDMDVKPEARVLAAAYTPKVKEGKKPAEGNPAHIYDIQPQMWVYENVGRVSNPAEDGLKSRPTGRAFVSIPGHKFATFQMPHYRAVLLRGIAWAGKRTNLDEYVRPEELSALTYPAGGPQKPEVTLQNLEVHPDFTMKLVASEPLIAKPMNFDWDPAGRLWVAETPEYPNGRRGMRPDYRGKEWKDRGGIDPTPGEQDRKAHDKISILTDTNGDGVMDKKDVFFEGLDLVTGFVFHRDGVIATQAPDILFLRDTDGDGKADKVEKLYSGLGTRDTHAVINNPRWGWDGWIYATHGYSSSDQVRNVKGETQGTIGSGVVRFRPDGSKIEQYSSKGGNTWGLTITADNRVMWTQPTSGQLLMQTVLPEYALARGKIGNTPSYKVVEPSPKSFPAMSWEQLAYVQIDWVGSFTAAAGCVIYDGGTWPAEYIGDYFTTEPTINVIHHTRLTPDGSSYKAAKLPGREETEFVRSRDMWWRPIEVRVGPDGAMYVADFYNQAVIHNDTRGPDHNNVNAAVRPDRDHYFGRLWKLDHKAAKKAAAPDLAKAAPADLARALESGNSHVRLTARRLIGEKGRAQGVSESGAGKGFSPDAIKVVAGALKHQAAEARIAALWTMGALGLLAPEQFAAALEDVDPAVRRNAALGAEALAANDAAATLDRKLADPDGRVRVAALLALAAAEPTESSAKSLIAAWPKFDDDFQRSAAVGAASRNPVAAISAALDLASEMGSARAPRAEEAAGNREVGNGRTGSGASPEPSSQPGAAADPKSGAAREPNDASGGAPDAARETRALPQDTLFVPLVVALTQNITSAEDAAKIVIALADKPGAAEELQRAILDSLAKSVKTAPTMTPELAAALGRLLGAGAPSPRGAEGTRGEASLLLGAALPLAAQWDQAGALKARVAELSTQLRTQLFDATADDNARLAAAQSLIGIRGTSAEILPAVVATLGAEGSAGFKRQLILALGEVDDRAVGKALAGAFRQLPPEARTVAFDTLLKRADWTHPFLDAVQAKQIDVATLGPANTFRLRTHQNKNVAERAAKLLDELNPMAKAKKDAIAKLAPIVEGKGDAEKGKALFTTTCATCHEFGGAGAKIGPGLTGMGSHGAGELLSAIVDPNAEVDPSFLAWNLETKDGQLFNGVIESENPTTITLKSLVGVQQVKVADLKSRVNTGRSLMPEGFEGLGGEAVRDIIAYMQSVDGGKFRTLDLRDAFTASTATGLYNSADAKADSFVFTKTGTVNLEGVPFHIVPPEKAPRNILVLKGGPERAYSKTLPQRVEVKAGGFKANRLHFLGGVTGWGYRGGGGGGDDVLKVTVHTTQGQREGFTFKNGVEFADYNGHIDVPGSKRAEGLVKGGRQVRWFSRQLAMGAVEIDRITIESLDTGAAPTLVAITAESGTDFQSVNRGADFQSAQTGSTPPRADLKSAPPSSDWKSDPQFTDPVPQPPATRPAKGPRVLLVGGGSSHDFAKFFGDSDKAILAPHVGWVDFTQNANGVPAILDRVDVLVWSANQPISSATRKALMDYVDGGKSVIAYHPGTWYAWANFPEWNAQVVGGGARGHDKLGEFEVTVTADHPVTAGVTKSFRITDELYYFKPDPAGTPIEVLATATSTTGKQPGTYPQVFIVKHPKARIVGLTLGHDARAHDLPEFQTLLRNAVQWAAGK